MLLPGLAAVGLGLLLFASLSFTRKTDYSIEAQPAFEALRDGHLGLFLDRCPAYGGSLILRAPLALLPRLWDGGPIALYRSISSPGVILLVIYGLVLCSIALRRRAGCVVAWTGLLLALANPLVDSALLSGHSEEVLVAVACLGSAFATRTNRAALAGMLFGVAVASKPWAVVAAAPLLLALERGHVRFMAAAGAATAAILAPLLLAPHGGLTATTTVARTTGTIANPWQIWWFFGDHGEPVYRTFGRVFHDYRTEPHWVTQLSHPLVVLVPAAICAARARVLRTRPWHDVFLLLAAVLFLRCLLDTWNHHYYAFPAVLALGTWEVLALRRAPIRAWGLTLLTLLTIAVVPSFATADVQASIYLAWSLPFAAWLLSRALRREEPAPETLE